MNIRFFFILLFVTLNPAAAYAQAGSSPSDPAIEWDRRNEISSNLTPLGLNLLGDSIDPHTGSISFEHTDVSLPGNSSLPVALTRKLTQGHYYRSTVDAEFGDWSYDVPRLSVVTAKTSASPISEWTGTRCTNPSAVFGPVTTGTSSQNVTFPVEYSNGLLLEAPGFGSQQVLAKTTNVTTPFPTSVNFVTAQNWKLTCGLANDGGDGFIGHAPDGSTYRFDRYVQYDNRRQGRIVIDGGNANAIGAIGRVKAMLMATQITDVNGNWVKYVYDSSNRLTQIHANDGRSITLTYSGTSKLVATATANGRTWTYNYTTASVSDPFLETSSTNKQILSTVVRPDNLSWSFNLVGMHHRPYPGRLCHNPGGSMSLTHPNGVTGTFNIAETKHRRGFAEWETVTTLKCTNAFVNPATPTYYDVYHGPMETMSVTQKTISGPGIPTSNWTYTYEQDIDADRYPVGHQFEGHPIASSETDPTNWTKVTGPTGIEKTYYHFWPEQYASATYDFGSKLDRLEIRASAGGTVLETQTIDYISTGIYGSTYIPNSYPFSPSGNIISPRSSGTPVRQAKVITQRDGDTWTQEFTYNTTQSSSLYSYGLPTQTKNFSNVHTPPRIRDTTYEHNQFKWVLGLPKTLVQNGRNLATYSYDTLGRKTSQTRYGVSDMTFTYHTTSTYLGAPYKITDALGRRTELLDWKRGTPQRIRGAAGSADETNLYQYVDNNGWLTSLTDPNGNITAYGQDNMGRLTLINPPGSWDNTSISYNFAGGGAIQTLTKGNARTILTYDSILRPTLERTQDLTNGASTYVKTTYNALGEVAFTSQPSASSNPTAGTNHTYDGLGRSSTSTETVTPFAQTRYFYYSSHRKRVYDPANYWTDYYRTGYEGPDGRVLRALYQPAGGTYTYMYRNVHGQLSRVQQWGNINGFNVARNQYYYYNAKQEMCRYHTDEGGDTLMSYNAAGQLLTQAKGMAAGTTCTAPSGNGKSTYSYDGLGRLTLTDYQGGLTHDISRSYDANSNVLTSNRSNGVNWTYAYDALNNLTSETLSLDGRSYALSYLYDTANNLTRRTIAGTQINYTHDGLGRIKTVSNGTTNVASGFGYHASGAVSGYTFGNGQVFSQTLTARLQPLRLRSVSGVNTALDLTYGYNNRGQVTSIIDLATTGNDRTYGYDPMGRLTSATGPWGAGSYVYDPLSNLRSKTLGIRTVAVSYDSLNRASYINDNVATNRTLGYDPRGNVKFVGAQTMVYDRSDQPIILSGTIVGNYIYDGNKKRVKSTAGGSTIYNIYDASGSLVHIDDLTAPKKITYVDKLARMTQLGTTTPVTTYLHHDHLGSAVSGTLQSGSVNWTEAYTPFGEKLLDPLANRDQASFTGHIDDQLTGLTYMQARYYEPVIGRFLSVDPVTFLSSGENPNYFNSYAYTFNDPVNLTDPNGECPMCIGALSSVVLGAVIRGATGGDIFDGKAIAADAALGAVGAGIVGKAAQLAQIAKAGKGISKSVALGKHGERAAGVAKSGKEGFKSAAGKQRFTDGGAGTSGVLEVKNVATLSSSNIAQIGDEAAFAVGDATKRGAMSLLTRPGTANIAAAQSVATKAGVNLTVKTLPNTGANGFRKGLFSGEAAAVGAAAGGGCAAASGGENC